MTDFEVHTPSWTERPIQPLPQLEQVELKGMLDWLSTYGADPQGGVTRLLYDQAWCKAQHALAEKMQEKGLAPEFDQSGNLYGTLHGRGVGSGVEKEIEAAPIVTGSHIDTVVHGGKYDGAYGVVAGVLALEYLQKHFGDPKRTLRVVSLCEEEGSRFPFAYWGSRSITGVSGLEDVQHLKDQEGITFAQAIRDAGFGPDSSYRSASHNYGAFIELHIEQGQVLERLGHSIGIVSDIVGQKRFSITVSGEANHAGTTPMTWRKDALAGAAEMITAVRHIALEAGEPLVATVGRITADPGIGNVVASRAVFSLDIRHIRQESINQCWQHMLQEFSRIAAEQQLGLNWEEHLSVTPIPMNEQITSDIRAICEVEQLSYIHMPSGAGHDSQIFQPACPTAMIFVPSQDGISHNPLEYTAEEDLMKGFRVLVQLLYKYGYGS
ncbi:MULTISPECIES: Zn-dependent hydrolase [unclassified Paenibacillus]|uniref:Zn-dependent hydrolase n=1 Tax=unclassified Paenibacillus TaxID=185978 RepID=UPI0008D5E1C1|nr:Zn-dependent hydrolase [Paenibacillus sp. OK076]SEN63188.1 allantoate deiminase [Paenibacillus sp. OK076]